MSKRNSAGGAGPSNTLLNYFSRTPQNNKNEPKSSGVIPKVISKPPESPNLEPPPKRMKRAVRLVIEDSDSDSENRSSPPSLGAPATANGAIEPNNDKKVEKPESNKAKEINSAKTKTGAGKKPFMDSSRNIDPALQDLDDEKETSNKKEKKSDAVTKSQSSVPLTEEGEWVHTKLEWLKPHMIMDACKRKPDHPEYDPTTLFVPSSFLNKQTPAHKQWWEMKSKHNDCVLFFKVGKFYELYHMDATVGVNELGFSYMKGEFAHSGFPESAYARMASTLVSKGYKVARVEQTETPDMMQERCKTAGKNTKCDKVVRREICQVTLRGVQVCGAQDPGPADAHATYMVCVTEQEHQGNRVYGVCFVDTSIGLFHLGQFKDDTFCSRLLTTLAHHPPALIIYDRKITTQKTCKLLAGFCPSARRENLALWNPEKTLKTLAEKYYRTNEDGEWPEGLRPFLSDYDALGLTPAKDCHLAIKALSGCVAFLTECLLDLQVLGMAQFTSYSPPVMSTASQGDKTHNWEGGSTMVLDAITLKNLRIAQEEGCLYERLNFCTTAMGKRLLYQWVCAPSCNLRVIQERQAAVKLLFEQPALCQDAKNILSTLPDLERLLAKVHALGNYLLSQHHPDSRAIFYEEKIYSKRKVEDFISILNGFTATLSLVRLFMDADSELLKRLSQFAPQGIFPDYRNTLKFFKEGFNQEQAEKKGRIMPEAGVDEQYDNIQSTINHINQELQTYLKEQERFFKCRLAYVGTDKKRFQIEVPISAVQRAGPDYQMVGARKGFKRFSTAETKNFLARMIEAEDKKTSIMIDLSRRLFEKFSSHYNQWESAVQCVATLDVLLSLAEFARQQTNDVCLPTVTSEANTKPYIRIVEGRHPCIPNMEDFIPNDTNLGVDTEAALLLLTGPNMGGKSTLMRQVGLLTVLAHLGSYVPAQECSLSLVDRVFTRLGASDDILSGQSTFFVEMNETAAIVKNATVHSLVLIDELGRGTSTHDGTAIAQAVCVDLAARRSRVIFSSHYHSLVRDMQTHPGVALGHMACLVEEDESLPNSDANKTIIFLYKLTPGICPASYGYNAAKLAGISEAVRRRAEQVANECLQKTPHRAMWLLNRMRDEKVLTCDNAADLRRMFDNLLHIALPHSCEKTLN